MNIYEAIMKAADQIEEDPSSFRFSATGIPHACGTPGCALGWIGFYAGMRRQALKYVSFEDVARMLDLCSTVFYTRMDDLTSGFLRNRYWWRNEAATCAKSLRKYAEKYHGHEKSIEAVIADIRVAKPEPAPAAPRPIGIPAGVRVIFTSPSQTIPDDGKDTVLTCQEVKP
jgi:hypothetical protein